jgi:L-serine dehydratase
MLGLAGQWPNSVDPAKGERTIAQIRERKRLSFDRSHAITFDPGADIVFDNTSEAKRHPNTMVLRAFDAHGIPLLEQTWCSVGGGFVCREEEVGKESATNLKTPAPFDFRSGEDPLTLGQESRLSIAEMVMANECAYPAAKTWKPTWTRSSQR